MSKSRVVSCRMTVADLAKARDGLIAKGISPSELVTTSQIIKTTFYYGIMYICKDPKSIASQESINIIQQKFNQTKKSRSLKLTDLEE